MAHIVFDLEWNQPGFRELSLTHQAQMHIRGEIIQIGAVKLDTVGHIIDRFDMITRPSLLTRLQKRISLLTGITNQDIAYGTPIPNALEAFWEWAGDDPVLFSWGPDDYQILVDNTRLYGLGDWPPCIWYDAQAMYSYATEHCYKQHALATALRQCGIEDDLAPHNALHDAMHAALVLQHFDYRSGMQAYDGYGISEIPYIFFSPDHVLYETKSHRSFLHVLRDKQVRQPVCPFCSTQLQMQNLVKVTGYKYINIGNCRTHGAFIVQIRKYKKDMRNGVARYCGLVQVSDASPVLQEYYNHVLESGSKTHGKKGAQTMLYLEYPKCSTCAKARAFLKEHGIEVEHRHIVEQPPTVEELAAWIPRSGKTIKQFFNTSGMVYRDMGLKDRLPAMSFEEQLQLLASNGMLVRRPILVTDKGVLVGFRPDAWSALLVETPC